MRAYDRLEAMFERLSHLGGAAAVLHWDSAVIMPPGGVDARSGQLATLAVVCHETLTAPEIPDLLATAEDDDLDDWQRANLRQMRRRWRHASALPTALVEARSRADNACEQAWRSARGENDFARLQAPLSEVVSLTREAAAAKAEKLGLAPYDALLDQYEAGLTSDIVDRCFTVLGDVLPGMISAAIEHQQRKPATALPGRVAADLQARLAAQLVAAVGLSDTHGRLDISHHPFTGGVPDDVRLTTRYDDADPLSSLMAALHETGHAMYERGLPPRWRHQPVGQSMGMAVHESQSLIVEMQASRSQPFVAHLAERMADQWQVDGPAWQAENLGRIVRRVERSLIRVDADEMTYPLHIILRYRLERALLSGDLEVADLPGAWREQMRALLDIEPPDDRNGCMQDVHWYGGDFGYFPTYTLGALAAAQLMDSALQARPDIPDALGRGDFDPLMSWLQQNVHALGSYPDTQDALMTSATGRPLGTDSFLAHLRRRYLEQSAA